MIFYFTGTGNSLAAAKKLMEADERLVNIADAVNHKEFEYIVNKGEKVGFVFPVYFYTLPDIVSQFIEHLQLRNVGYIYSVITCGGGIAQAGSVLKKALSKKKLTLDYVSALQMPDNYILLYKNSAEGTERCLAEAEQKMNAIAGDIAKRKKTEIGSMTLISDITGAMYQMARTTSKFYAEDTCIGCGMCKKNCPEKAINLADGKPVWMKKKCSQCLACINRCPVCAIQYGKRTKKQGRYVHPDLK